MTDGGVTSVLESAAKAGVNKLIAPSLHLDSHSRLEELRQHFPQIYPAVGVHPHEASPERSKDLARKLEARLERADIPIVGETGLEGHYDFTPMAVQLESLTQHLQVADDHGVPVILHCRETEELLYKELCKYKFSGSGVVHCFTGTWEWAQRFLELGFYIGLTGIVTFKNAHNVHEVARKTPVDRLLVETDGPYLAPIPFRGKTNKPEYIPYIVEQIARLRAEDPVTIGKTTALNAENLFGIP